MDREICTIIEIIEALESRINSYWNFYVVVVIATIGWLMSSSTPFSKTQGVALTIAVLIFLVSNFMVLSAVTKRVIAFEVELNCVSRKQEYKSVALKEELSQTSMRNRLFISYALHGVIDIAVLSAIVSKIYL